MNPSEQRDNSDPAQSRPANDPAAGNTQHSQPASAPRAHARSKGVKYGFIALFVAAALGIYLLQLRGQEFPDWQEDLDAALRQARTQQRGVLVYFVHSTSSATVRTQWKIALSRERNKRAIENAKLIRVVAEIALNSEAARRFNIERLPTLTILSDHGTLCKRSQELIGQVEFRTRFLEPTWSGWTAERDLSGTLPLPIGDAPVVALFTAGPSGGVSRHMAYTTLAAPEVQKALTESGAKTMHVILGDTMPDAAPIARAHDVTHLPTLLVLRRGRTAKAEGYVSPAEFIELLSGRDDAAP